MSLRINTNIAALGAQTALVKSQRKLDVTMKQLASGSRFADPTAGAGDFAISEHLKAQLQGQKAARNNADNAQGFLQVAEGGLNEQNNILIRMREIAVQASSDTFSETERGMLDQEFQQLSQELDRVARTTKFGSTKLLAGEGNELEFQVGSDGSDNDVVKFNSDANTTAGALDISGQSIADKYDARSSLQAIDGALTIVAQNRARFGAVQSRFESVISTADTMIENLDAARSRIADTDYAAAASEMAKQQAMSQYQVAILSQANQFPQTVLRLIA